MKKVLILLILIFFTINSFAQIKFYEPGFKTGVWKEYYSNGQLHAIGDYVDGVITGDWKLYYYNGKLNAEGKYQNNNPVPGTWKTYNKTGELNDCGCPPPLERQKESLAVSVYERQSTNNPRDYVSYGYQEQLFYMACVKKDDSFDVIKKKVQALWGNYGELLMVYNYPNTIASEKNILKFSLDAGFTALLTEMNKRYNVDMNFIDPGDGKTIMDFIEDRIIHVQNTQPVDDQKVAEYKRIRDALKKNGALHSYELTKPSKYIMVNWEFRERN